MNNIKKSILCVAILYFSIGFMNAQSTVKRLPDGTYINDCSHHKYVLKQNPSFSSGNAQLEKELLQEFRTIALKQDPDGGIGCDITLRLFPNGNTKFISSTVDKTIYKPQIKQSLKRMFLGKNKWKTPVFVNNIPRSVDIIVTIWILRNAIEYDFHVIGMDYCEGSPGFGKVIVK